MCAITVFCERSLFLTQETNIADTKRVINNFLIIIEFKFCKYNIWQK